MDELNDFDLPEQVVDKQGNIFTVDSVKVFNNKEQEVHIGIHSFNRDYRAYIDPKDIRIQALEDELKELREKIENPRRKKRRILTDGEIKEIEGLIRIGEEIHDIAAEYESSTSAIYRIRQKMNQNTVSKQPINDR